jgi:S1-C subfamily serine protease
LGFATTGRAPGVPVVIAQVVPSGPAEAAGLKPGDVILAVNNQTPPRFFPGWIREQTTGEKISLRVHRDGKDFDISYALGTIELKKYSIIEAAHPTEKQKRIREGWLQGRTD